MTAVIHIKKAPKGWRNDPSFVYIGRPSKWGNPYDVQTYGRETCIEMFKNTFDYHKDLHELKDKTLVCYCNPLHCHGDFLAELVNT